MVSFSCDYCQDVQTRKRVDTHFMRCRTRSVSCIDCGSTFDARSVKHHTSCITEAEKYEGGARGFRKSTNAYCAICDLAINGLVAAEQHYNSKKHKKNERATKLNTKRNQQNSGKPVSEVENKAEGSGKRLDIAEEKKMKQETPHKNRLANEIEEEGKRDILLNREENDSVEKKRMTPAAAAETLKPSGGEKRWNEVASKGEKRSVKRMMKSILKKQKGQRMRKSKLLMAIMSTSQDVDVTKITDQVSSLVGKSRRFEGDKKYIRLIGKQRE